MKSPAMTPPPPGSRRKLARTCICSARRNCASRESRWTLRRRRAVPGAAGGGDVHAERIPLSYLLGSSLRKTLSSISLPSYSLSPSRSFSPLRTWSRMSPARSSALGDVPRREGQRLPAGCVSDCGARGRFRAIGVAQRYGRPSIAGGVEGHDRCDYFCDAFSQISKVNRNRLPIIC